MNKLMQTVNSVSWSAIIVVLVYSLIVGLVSVGCVTKDVESGKLASVRNQYNSYNIVKERSKQLQVGMNKYEVLSLLGSPAQQTSNIWIYLPDRMGAIVPAESMHVTFDRGVYVSHKFNLIVFGSDTGK